MKKPSIIDVAQKSGFSIATVSRALNGNTELVSPKTRDAILRTAKEMRFELRERRASPTPRAARKKKKLISFLALLDPIYKEVGIPPVLLELKDGIDISAQENECRTDMHLVSNDKPLPDEILERNPHGFVLVGEKPKDNLTKELMQKPCCWVLDNRFNPEWGDQIAPNHRKIGFIGTNYLIDQGCRDILSVNLGPDNHFLRLRETGIRDACRRHDIEYRKIHSTREPSTLPVAYPATAYLDEVTRKIKILKKKPDGIFFDSDYSASLLIPRLLNEGIRLDNGNTAMIGCNNQKAYLHTLDPRPATIDIHLRIIGELAVSQLLYRIKNGIEQPRIHSYVSPSLVNPSGKPPRSGGFA